MNKIFKPTGSSIWDRLHAHRESMNDFKILQSFKSDPQRYEKFHAGGAGILLDYSKNLVNEQTLNLLIEAVNEIDLAAKIEGLFSGDKVNITEDRPALHTALRDPSPSCPQRNEIDAVFDRMTDLVDQVIAGSWTGCTGKTITDVINIGIGGSHLGPMMVQDAMQGHGPGSIRSHFVSNLDKSEILSVLSGCNAESTVFIICSKSFTTQETLQNAHTARSWLEKALPVSDWNIANHFLAVTASIEMARKFGIAEENILPMWDWVGGRYSLWSAIGLSSAISMGMENFNRMRDGAAEMDEHFRNTAFDKNLPVLLAVLGVWYINYWDAQSQAVLPYLNRLRFFPEFLQQLEMESNGKSVSLQGSLLEYHTAPVIWGTVETNGQHSFHQLLHQGSRFVPVDFIVSLLPDDEHDQHHAHLVSNCLAQSNALMTGNPLANENSQSVHRYLPGNRPSNILSMQRLTPECLGALVALYEHKVFVQSIIWNINAFDQFGVELGKRISNQVQVRLTGDENAPQFDPSTEALIGLYRKVKSEK